jgi:hypothetical protein
MTPKPVGATRPSCVTLFDVHVGEKPVSPPNDCLNESRLAGAVPQRQAHLTDGGIEAMVQILEAAVAPESGSDHIAR